MVTTVVALGRVLLLKEARQNADTFATLLALPLGEARLWQKDNGSETDEVPHLCFALWRSSLNFLELQITRI